MIPLVAPVITQVDQAAVMAVLDTGNLTQGSEVAAFEQEFSAHVEDRETVAVSSGTAALITALISVGVGAGDEVVVPSFTFAATANAVSLVGARPIFADIDPDHFCLSPRSVEDVLTDRTTAIIPVHLYGHPAPMPEITAIATAAGIPVIEDACQAFGASLHEQPVGTFGDLAVFSLYATKHIVAGEGGVVVSANPEAAEHCRILRNQGLDSSGVAVSPGYNFRMTDVAAALARSQLRRSPAMLATRRRHAWRYDAGLTTVTTPKVAPGVAHAYGSYTVRSDRRDDLLKEIRTRGVDARAYYPVPVHRMPAHLTTNTDLPETEMAAATVVSIPVGPHLSDEQVGRIIDVVSA